MWWTADRQAHAVSYLVANGLSPVGAAGLVSRWVNVESTGAGASAVNPYSGAFGIAQWLGARLTPIRGNTSFDDQLAYVVEELYGSESRAGGVLRNAVDANRAAVGASMYERAEGYNPSNGRDNFTSRTASGVAAVLANSGGGNSDSSSSGIIADNAGLTELPYAPPEASSNLDSWLMAGLVGLLAFVVWEWVTD